MPGFSTSRTSEGHRIVWVHSSAKQHRDETARHERIQRTLTALAELNDRLAGPRARISTRVAAHDAAAEIVDTSGAEQYITFTISESTEERFRQEKRGRPGNDTRYRKLTKTRASRPVFPSVPGSSSSSSSQTHLTASARFRARAYARYPASSPRRPPGGMVLFPWFPVAFRPPAFASRSSFARRGVGPSSRSAYRPLAGPRRGYPVPHTRATTGLGAL